MAEGINQHKRMAMGQAVSGQHLKKGGSVREEGVRHERTEPRAMERREDAGMKKGGFIKPSHKGRLHSALGVAQGKPIPAAKLQGALRSTNAHVRAMANFAKNAKRFGK